MTYPQKYYFLSLFVMGDFTQRLLKNIEKTILCKCVLGMLLVGQRERERERERERINNALTSS